MKHEWLDRSVCTITNSVLSVAECESIIEIGCSNDLRKSTLMNQIDSPHRKSANCWLDLKVHHWVVERLEKVAFAANKHLQLEIDFLDTIVQFTKYGEGSHYDFHYDIGTQKLSRRKMSIVVMLSDPTEFSGGELEFISNGSSFKPRQGSAIAFPSFEVHRVRPVLSGERYTLVAWVEGKPFR